MKIWVCTTTYNNEKWLPFFLRHYNFVEGFFVYDCGSTDNTIQILENQPNVILKKTNVPFDEMWLLRHRNNDWKGLDADWVFIVDPDELIYHKDIVNFLGKSDCSIIITQGYEMFLDSFPESYEQLTKLGVVNDWYSKPVIFNPRQIQHINFRAGCHCAEPVGNIKIDGCMINPSLFQDSSIIANAHEKFSEIKLLHYRYFGKDSILNRWNDRKKRMTKNNTRANLANHYFMDINLVIEIFEEAKKLAVEV